RALPPPTADRRTGLREHQVPPPDRPLPTTRLTRLQGRMEADRLHAQPAQTLARDNASSCQLTPIAWPETRHRPRTRPAEPTATGTIENPRPETLCNSLVSRAFISGSDGTRTRGLPPTGFS